GPLRDLHSFPTRRSSDLVEPIDVFTQADEHIKPTVEVRSKRVGGATYQVPMQVNRTRQQSLAIRWLIGASRSKKGRPMFLRLARSEEHTSELQSRFDLVC